MVKVRGQDEGIKTDKGTYNSPEDGRSMAPAEIELGSLGTTGASEKCGR